MQQEKENMQWNLVENAMEGALFLGEEISREIKKIKSNSILFLVSGGSCLNVLPYISNKNFEKVTVAVLDERFDVTNEHNNFSQLRKNSWSESFLNKGGKFISSAVTENETQEDLAIRFQSDIENWISDNKNGKIMALFGMGADGHTAGVFPYPENINFFQKMFNAEKLVVAYDAKEKNQFPLRITTTNALFGKLEIGFLYVCGEEKKKALDNFIKGEISSHELPVMFLRKIKRLKIVTDIK